jgi:GTP-binding protein
MKKRIVAIVGRPNVGKSAIFNRLAGRRIAIVHEESGVTRDRLMREVSWNDEMFDLIDTGGIANVRGKQTHDKINQGIRDQVDAALDDAEVAILVVDVTAGVVSMDEEVAGILRDNAMKVVVAVNKCDNQERDDDGGEFEKLGLPLFPVSALHDRGFESIMSKVLEMLPEEENPTEKEPLRVAIAGRPNVGKSSFVNRLLRSDRVIVSNIPGTTRDSIDVPFTVGTGVQARRYRLIDTAGIRRVGKIDTSVERFSRFRAEKSIRESDVVVLVLDAVQGPTAQDKKIAAIIQEEKKGCVVLVNKWDLQEETQTQYGPQVYRTMPFVAYCPIVFASSKTGYNIRRSIDAIDHVAAQVRTDLPTGVLNRTLQDAYEKVKPPAINGARLKIYYATQTGVAPIRIKLFVNNPKVVRDAYRSYLIKTIRKKFGLEGAPIILNFTARKRVRKG